MAMTRKGLIRVLMLLFILALPLLLWALTGDDLDGLRRPAPQAWRRPGKAPVIVKSSRRRDYPRRPLTPPGIRIRTTAVHVKRMS